MSKTLYELEWARQLARTDVEKGHLPVHRWYLRIDDLESISQRSPEKINGTRFERFCTPSVAFYRELYHTAGENWLWGDRRRMSDGDLLEIISHPENEVIVLYEEDNPAGFYEISTRSTDCTEIKYFALLPEFTGRGLGRFMLTTALNDAARHGRPIFLDTCSLDHPAALENYLKSGFQIDREEDESYPDPRLDGTIPEDVGSHVPLAQV